MNFYAYLPDSAGKEPMGTEHKLLVHNRKSYRFISYARRVLDNTCRVFSFTNFYNDKTFRQVYGSKP